jgi:hypothetical protein
MGFLDKLKDATNQAKQASTSFASGTVGALWSKYGDGICETILSYASKAAAKGSEFIADDDKYKLHVIDPAWELMPAPVRLLGRERLKWDAAFFAARSKLFVVDGSTAVVHPDAKDRLDKMFAKMLPSEASGGVQELPSLADASPKDGE